MPELRTLKKSEIDTPFGPPSDALIVGTLEGERVAFCRVTDVAIASRRRGSVSRKHLCDEVAWRRENSFGVGGWIVAGEVCAAGHGDSRSVF